MESIGRPPFPHRHLALLLLVFLVPCGVITALAIRTLSQDRELAVRRAEDERRQLAATIRQDFLARLERLKLRALSGGAAAPSTDRSAANAEPIVLVARIDDGRLVLPWEDEASARNIRRLLADAPFAALISRGETQELVQEQPGLAAASYRRAWSAAHHPVQTASAEILAARALGKAGRPAEALDYTRRTLARPLSLVDEQGVPFALYAARRVVDLKPLETADAAAALDIARQSAAIWTSPAGVHMAAAVASTLRSNASADIQERAAAAQADVRTRIARVDQVLALQQTFPALAGQFPSTGTRDGESFWLPFGQDPWLVSRSTDINSRQPIAIAVDARRAFDGLETVARCAAAGGCRLALLSATGADGYALGPALPGLTVLDVIAGEGNPGRWLPRTGFYIAALSLVLLLAALGAYLLWRDVRRELRLAELRSQFVASVSHELKTPLTAIRMFAETLRMGRPAEPARRDEYLDTIINESERLTRLLNNVLDFSRIESGHKIYESAPHDLESIVRTAARAMQYPLARQGFVLQVSIADGVPPLPIDADALEQAILNLLANALKYSGDARTVELSLTRDDADAVIAVRDRGIGIDPIDQRRIFEKFYRVARPENRLIPGTGLGLTLVDHIVRAHHGRVDVESAPGAGSTFRIRLPLSTEQPANVNAEDQVPAAARRAEA